MADNDVEVALLLASELDTKEELVEEIRLPLGALVAIVVVSR